MGKRSFAFSPILASAEMSFYVFSTTIAFPFRLDRWTRNGSIRAVHAAISLFGFEYFVTIFTFIKKLTGICGHRFFFLMATMRTRDHGF